MNVAASLPALDAFERDFAAALTSPAVDGNNADLPAFARQPGFAVYRNTVAAACIDALAANYSVVLQIVGEAWFRDAALRFARAHPPSDGSLTVYGAGFADFLAAFEPCRELPYLPGVARLDRLWTEAHVAADAPRLSAGTLAALSPQGLATAVLVTHPSARWARFEGVPAFTLWRRHREGGDVAADVAWAGEQALIVRPGAAVEWHALTAPAAAFLDACATGAAFAEAADAVGETDSITALTMLLAAGAFTSLRWLPA